MSELAFRQTIQTFPALVVAVETLELTAEEGIARLKAKLRLFDGTFLWVREVCIRDRLEDYSYYWLRPDNTPIIGWDNAPHHKQLASFPHHKHIGNTVESSNERNLTDVLSVITEMLH